MFINSNLLSSSKYCKVCMTRSSKWRNCRQLSRTIDFPTCSRNVLILALLCCLCPFAYPNLRCLIKFLLILFFVLQREFSGVSFVFLCLFNSFHVLVFNSEHCLQIVFFFVRQSLQDIPKATHFFISCLCPQNRHFVSIVFTDF